VLVSVEAFFKGLDETCCYRDVANAVGGVFDRVVVVDDCLAPLHLVLDVVEGWAAVGHLVEDASQTPDIAWFSQLHEFRSV